jgi:hypothetical protein
MVICGICCIISYQLGDSKMPQRCELTILSGNPLKDLDFGSIFNDCLSAFQSNGSYSEISVSDEKFLTKTISLEFCKIVKGTLFGHYPLYAPTSLKQAITYAVPHLSTSQHWQKKILRKRVLP